MYNEIIIVYIYISGIYVWLLCMGLFVDRPNPGTALVSILWPFLISFLLGRLFRRLWLFKN